MSTYLATRRTVNVEDTSSKAIVAIDGVGFDWSYMADDEAPTNMAFMAFYTLRGLVSIEEQLVHYKKNENLLNENIAVLERDILIKDHEIAVLKSKLEKISKEKDGIEITIEKFKNASQSLDKLIGSQITNKSKRGLGYESEVEDDVESPPEIERNTVEPSVDKMDVKSAFLYGRIEEEVYMCQPPRFEDLDYPNKVYKVKKALYGLHQAPRALYVDDIIFDSTKKELCNEFKKLMHDKFQMSLMGELTFFLGLQVKQKLDVIFISQDKYVNEILRKFKYANVKPASTPTDKEKAFLKDSDGDDVDVHLYRSMIGSLMYLTLSRPDIMFA
nr:retrovirus-related Pol polyprotein from transposon TNT 1-94 [Tanacetum cinerariifolium]